MFPAASIFLVTFFLFLFEISIFYYLKYKFLFFLNNSPSNKFQCIINTTFGTTSVYQSIYLFPLICFIIRIAPSTYQFLRFMKACFLLVLNSQIKATPPYHRKWHFVLLFSFIFKVLSIFSTSLADFLTALSQIHHFFGIIKDIISSKFSN